MSDLNITINSAQLQRINEFAVFEARQLKRVLPKLKAEFPNLTDDPAFQDQLNRGAKRLIKTAWDTATEDVQAPKVGLMAALAAVGGAVTGYGFMKLREMEDGGRKVSPPVAVALGAFAAVAALGGAAAVDAESKSGRRPDDVVVRAHEYVDIMLQNLKPSAALMEKLGPTASVTNG
ncbi:MAG TPA: hypothetical protein VFR09_08875 [Alphaproteobacteria bacterium]|nr:hypothetical protein [Alphaproteobacteria bacterium]